MEKLNDYSDIKKEKQSQILKLVTNSFYRELVNYGVNSSDIVTVSVNLLDFVTNSQGNTDNNDRYYNNLFQLSEIDDNWDDLQTISFKDVKIRPLKRDEVSCVSKWLSIPGVSQTFISFFPKEESELAEYLLNHSDRRFLSVYYKEDNFVGIIGAENYNQQSKKLEMKKFIGAEEFRSKGIGKLATFLFLYLCFEVLDINKVFIHSLDTNIKNINLNSKFGFELEGILYADAYLDNSYRDVLRMGLLRDNWRSIFA